MQERGGAQGDYREGMPHKIANAIDCLKTHNHSKRAIIPIPFNSEGSENVNWHDAGQTKVVLRCLVIVPYLVDWSTGSNTTITWVNASEFFDCLAITQNPSLLFQASIILPNCIVKHTLNACLLVCFRYCILAPVLPRAALVRRRRQTFLHWLLASAKCHHLPQGT